LIAWPPFVDGIQVRNVIDGLAQSQYWPAADIARGQQLQLMHLLEWAGDSVAHYRDAAWAAKAVAELKRSPAAFWDIWSTLPILTKAELRSECAQMSATDVPKEHLPVGKTITSGSTGISVEVATTAVTRLMWNALTLREMYWRGREFDKRLGAIRYLAKADRDPQGYFAASWPKLISQHEKTGSFGIIHVGHPVDVLARWLQQLDPHYLITHPSVGEALLHELGVSGKPCSLEEILVVAEPLSTALEARMADEWGVRCAEYYSANEVGYIALRCRERGRLHVQSESVLVEIIDAAGKPCGVGEAGRVVVTPLHNVATPLIRYELGDYATVGQPCACGRSLPVIDRVLGRVRNLVHTPDGRRHWPVDLGKFRSMSAVRQFQYVQSGPATIELRVVLNQPLTAEEEVLAKAFVREALGYPFQVEITPVPEIARGPTGKFEEFLSLLPAD
jgi:phenylacetate-CoA ligase